MEGDEEDIGDEKVIRRESDGKIVGVMLEGKGFVSGIVERDIEVKGMKECIIGEGGED